jgi:hypothetical protein
MADKNALLTAYSTTVNYAIAVHIVTLNKKRSPIILVWVIAIIVKNGWQMNIVRLKP